MATKLIRIKSELADALLEHGPTYSRAVENLLTAPRTIDVTPEAQQSFIMTTSQIERLCLLFLERVKADYVLTKKEQ